MADPKAASEEMIFRLGKFDQEYKWSAGQMGSRFFAALRDQGKILGVRCHQCGRVLVPPRSFCEDCFVPLDDVVEVGQEGELHTFSVSYLNPDASPADHPWAVGIVKLDGASTGLLHFLGGVKNPVTDYRIGMRMRVVFKPQAERKGEILDILHFAPVT